MTEKRTGARIAPGMKRTSYYATIESHEEIKEAIELVYSVLDKEMPKHTILSRLLIAGAGQADQVAADMLRDLARRPPTPTQRKD